MTNLFSSFRSRAFSDAALAVFRILTLSAVFVLSACTDNPAGPLADHDPSDGAKGNGAGQLIIRAQGLPVGATADAVIRGPGGFERHVSAGDTLRGLGPGQYTVSAAPVITSQGTWEPTLADQAVAVGYSGQPQAVVINFGLLLRSAIIIVNVTGLPANANASVVASQPGGVNARNMTRTDTIAMAPTGIWQIDASPVRYGNTTYAAVQATQSRNILARETVTFSVRYQEVSGSLAVAIVGLPSGASGNVQVTGPNGFSRSLTSTTTLTGLDIGTYNVSASSVTVSGITYSPTPTSTNVAVSAGEVAAGATVSYAAQAAPTGSISLTIAGLPSGMQASVNVTGPNEYNRSVTSTTTLSDLKPGAYTVSASPVRGGSGAFGASPSSTILTVQSGGTARGTVTYSALPSVVQVPISGLPGGTNASVTLTSPSGSNSNLTASSTISPAATGRWRLSAANVTSGGNTYKPTPTSYDQTVLAGDTLEFPVTYALSTGSLAVSITGLPSGTAGSVSVTGPGGYSKQLTATQTLTDLTPGSYTVSAAAVTAGGLSYSPSPATRTVTVSASLVAASAAVTYSAQSGKLALTVAGLPSGTNADITVTGPNSYSEAVTGTTTLNNLPVGTYTITSGSVRSASGSYSPSPASRSVSITANGTASETVTYAALPAVVKVVVSGLPGGTNASVTLTSPSNSNSNLTASSTISPAATGRWRLSAANVSSGGNTYKPTPTSYDQTVLAGDTLEFPVTYALSTGSLAVSITGLPSGTSGSVSVTGPGGYSKQLTATQTLTDLTPGSYTVSAAAVTAGGLSYSPSPATRTVTVSASLVAASAAVTYSAQSGKLALTVAGLPSGTNADITVTGPNSYSEAVTGTTTLNNLPVGTYTITSSSVRSASGSYSPSPASRSVNITANGTASETITYALSTGSLAVSVTGLPTGTAGSVSVTGPGGYSKQLTATQTLTDLTPGSYTVTAAAVTAGGLSYSPSPATRSVTVSASLVATSAEVAYAAQGGGGSGGGGTPGGGSATTNLSIENVYVTQAAQNWEGTAPIVSGRDALLRVFVKADDANSYKPDVRVKIYAGATLVSTVTIPATASSVPTSISEGTMSASWNVVVPASNVRMGMKVLAELDPTNSLNESNRADNVWPRDGAPKAINTIDPPVLNIKFVPVSVAGRVGNVSSSNVSSWLEMMQLIFPVRDINASVRATFTSNAPALQSNDDNNGWSTVLSEISALQRVEASPIKTHYYGVVSTTYSSGYAGLGYAPGRAAVGWDRSGTYQEVFAHEIGHNFGLSHSPCGVSGSSMYPYAGGKIGTWGWNARTNSLIAPTATDVMGYCSNQWVSDWTWNQAAYGRNYFGVMASAAALDGMLIWGAKTTAGVVVEPAFSVIAAATPEPATATHVADLYDDYGSLITSYRFAMEQVDHGGQREHFSMVVPLSKRQQQMVARIAIRPINSPLPLAALRGNPANRAMALGDTAVALDTKPASVLAPTADGRVRVRWNEKVFRMGMVRDRNTGEILSFLRQPGDEFVGHGRSVEIVFSDGTRSVKENH